VPAIARKFYSMTYITGENLPCILIVAR